MNIFYLDSDPKTCAQMHNDKHCVKMILEYAQLMSTAHRVLDGSLTTGVSDKGRKSSSWILEDERNSVLYKATHINHPSAIWVRQSASNYRWLFELFCNLLDEYTYRYGKRHKCEGLIGHLAMLPKNISTLYQFTEPTPAMPEDIKVKGSSIASYKNYYIRSKQHLANWKSRETPKWYSLGILELLTEESQRLNLY